MTKQLKNVVTAAEINEFLYDPFFKNDVRSLLHFMEVVAESQFVPLEHVCVGVGYRESEQKNRSSFLYLHNPETNEFKKYYDARFEYSRISFWGLDHYKNEHQFWLTYAEVVRLSAETESTQSLDMAQV